MRIGVTLPGMCLYPGGESHWAARLDASEIADLARAVERLGFDILRVPEHIVMRRDLVDLMGARYVDCTSAVSFLAGITERIRISALIVVLYHHPVELAKSLATIDWLSNGRLIFQPALGYMEWEYVLMGAPPFSERFAAFDEYMEAIAELWTSDAPSYAGTYVRFDDIAFDPKPVQKPRPLTWMAGNSRASAVRAARFGDGWWPNGISRQRLSRTLEHIREQPEFADRERPFDIFLNLFEREVDLTTHVASKAPQVVIERDAILEELACLAGLGVTLTDADSVLGGGIGGDGNPDAAPPVRSATEFVERLQWFSEEILPSAHAL